MRHGCFAGGGGRGRLWCRAGCGRRAGAVLALLLAMTSCAASLLQALERAGAVEAWRDAAPPEASPALRALHLALAAARVVEAPLLLIALCAAILGRRRVTALWLAWAPVAVGTGAAQSSLALAQLVPLMEEAQVPLAQLHTARMALYSIATLLSSLASVMLVESFRRGGGGDSFPFGAHPESRRSFELPPLPSRWAPQAPRNNQQPPLQQHPTHTHTHA